MADDDKHEEHGGDEGHEEHKFDLGEHAKAGNDSIKSDGSKIANFVSTHKKPILIAVLGVIGIFIAYKLFSGGSSNPTATPTTAPPPSTTPPPDSVTTISTTTVGGGGGSSGSSGYSGGSGGGGTTVSAPPPAGNPAKPLKNTPIAVDLTNSKKTLKTSQSALTKEENSLKTQKKFLSQIKNQQSALGVGNPAAEGRFGPMAATGGTETANENKAAQYEIKSEGFLVKNVSTEVAAQKKLNTVTARAVAADAKIKATNQSQADKNQVAKNEAKDVAAAKAKVTAASTKVASQTKIVQARKVQVIAAAKGKAPTKKAPVKEPAKKPDKKK